MGVLSVEKVTDAVEFDLAAFRGGAVRDVGVTRRDGGDQRLGVVRPPVGGGLLDGLQIGHLLGPVTHPLPKPVGGLGLGARAVEVGVEELPVGGDHVPAEGDVSWSRSAACSW